MAVQVRDEGIEGLAFDVLECGEEGSGTEGVAEERERPPGKDAPNTDVLGLAPGILPHVVVFALDELGGVEADLESIYGGCDETLNGACHEPCGQCCRWWWQRIHAFGSVRRGRMKMPKELEIRRVQHGSHDCVGQERGENLVGNE